MSLTLRQTGTGKSWTSGGTKAQGNRKQETTTANTPTEAAPSAASGRVQTWHSGDLTLKRTDTERPAAAPKAAEKKPSSNSKQSPSPALPISGGQNTAQARSGKSRGAYDSSLRDRLTQQRTREPATRTREEQYDWVGQRAARKKADRKDSDMDGWKLLEGMAVQGATGFAESAASTLDLIERQLLNAQEVFMPTGGERVAQGGPFRALHEGIRKEQEDAQAYYQPNVEKGGTAAKVADFLGTTTFEAIPQGAMATISAGAKATQAGVNVLNRAAELSPGLWRSIRTAAKGAMENPAFWSSFLQTVGSDYDESIANGASEGQALTMAVTNGLMNAGIEVGGGLETIDPKKRFGVKDWVKSAVEEGNEEVGQGLVQRGLQNLVYQKGNPLFSTTDGDAVLNPWTSAQEWGGGAFAGGVLSGASAGTNALMRARYNQQLAELGAVYQADPGALVEEGLSFAPETRAHQTAAQMQEKANAGQALTDADLGAMVAANEQTMEQQRQLERANTPETRRRAQPNTLAAELEAGKRLDMQSLTDDQMAEWDAENRTDFWVDGADRVYQMQPEQHISQRSTEALGDRSVNAFQFDHPELQPYYKQAAQQLIRDASISIDAPKTGRMERTTQGKRYVQKILDTPSLRLAMNEGLSRSEIISAAQALIHDQGQENYAAAKRLELVLNRMLTEGYTTAEGERVEANADYLQAVQQIPGYQERERVSLPIWDTAETDRTEATRADTQTALSRMAAVRQSATVLGENGAKALTAGYDIATAQDFAPEEIVRGFYPVYNAALNGTELTGKAAEQADALPKHLRLAAESAGERDAARAAQAQYFGENAGLRRDALERKAHLSSKTRRSLDALGKALGVEVRFAQTVADGAANAQYKDGVITLALDADDPVLTSAVHEAVHRIRETAPEAYQGLAEFVHRSMSEEGEQFNLGYRAQLYQTDNADRLTEEMVADAFGRMVGSEELLDQLSTSRPTILQKIADVFHDILAAIQRALNRQDLKLTTEQKAAFQDLQGRVTAMDRAFRKALAAAEQAKPLQGRDGDGTMSAARLSLKDLTEDERTALLQYKSSESYKVNAKLRDGLSLTTAEQKMTADLDTALEKLPVHEGTVYRRLSFDMEGQEALEAFLAEHAAGTVAPYKAYTSSSTAIDGYPVNGKLTVTQIISSKTGRDMAGIGNNNESEVMFPRNTRFYVEKVRTDANGKIAIYMEEVTNHGIGQLHSEERMQAVQQMQAPQGENDNLQKIPGVDTRRGADGRGLPGVRGKGTEEVKFSLKSPVEETRDLLALHNKDEKSILAALKLGGLPMPSIAVVKASEGHSKYGPISLVFSKATIDPQADSRNKVYGSDAWTPTSSDARVDYKVDHDVKREFEQNIELLANDVAGGIFSQSNVLDMAGVTDQTSMSVEEIAHRLATRYDSVRAAYLSNKGKDVDVVYRTKEFDSFGNDALKSYLEKVGAQEAARLAAKTLTGERLSAAEVETVKDAIMESWTAKNEWRLNKKPELRETRIAKQREKLSDLRAEDFARNAWDFYEDGGTTTNEVNRMETAENLRHAVDDKAVEAWVLDMLHGLTGEPGIYNGSELFDARGNRKSFKETHWSYTLENIVRAMNTAKARGQGIWGMSGSGLAATATPAYNSIQEMHADESRLRTVDEADYEQMVKALDGELDRAAADIMHTTEHHASSTFDEEEIIGDVIAMAAQGKRTTAGVKQTFRKEGYTISDKQAHAVLEVIEHASSIPTEYFEAKPQRAVGFDEVLAAVIPDDSSETLRGALEQAGVRTLEYKAWDEADRLAKVNSVDGARFSLKDVNGKQVVWLENSPLTAKELSNHETVAEYITQHIGEFYTIIESGQKVYLGKDLPREYTHSKYTDTIRKRRPALLKAKNKATGDLGLLIETATNRRWEKTRHQKSKDAAYGMYRYDSAFAFPVKDSGGAVQRVRAYDIELLIRNASDGKKYLYDIVNIKENTADAIDLNRREARLAAYRKAASHDDVSMDSIRGGGEDVNGEFSRKDKETLAEYVKQYGAIPKGEKAARFVEMPKQTGDGKYLSQTVRTILEAKATPDELVPSIEALAAKGDFSYDRYTDKAAMEDAEKQIKHLGWAQTLTEWTERMKAGEVSKANTAMGWALYNNAANSGDTQTALSVLEQMVTHQRSAAQALQATRILKKLSPETQLYLAQRSVENLQEELNQRFGPKNGPVLEISQDLAEEYLAAETQAQRDEALKNIYRDIGRQMPSTFLDRWNAWRYLAMLGNPRTHVRNIVGNLFFAPVVAAKDLTATGIESMVYRVSGGKMQRSKSLVLGTRQGRALLKAAFGDYAKIKDAAMGGGKYSDFANANQYIEEGRRIFGNTRSKLWNKTGGALLEAARKGNGAALDAEDAWFSQPHYAYALAQYCKAHNISAAEVQRGKSIKLAREYAILEAQKATYRDTNALSQTFSELGRVNKGSKNAVKKGLATLAEGILPFRKTPANILARGLEYSPLGLMNGIKQAAYDVQKGRKTAAEAIDTLSAGLTGTGLLALGVYLAAEGLVRGHGGDDDDKRKMEEMMGHQAYALELPDGTSATLDWMAPEALPFFVGVNLWENTQGGKEQLTLSSVLDSVSTISEPLLEMSCLQSLNDVFDSVSNVSDGGLEGLPAALSSAATSYLTQALPTVLGQAERTGEDKRYTTFTEKNAFLTPDMQYTIGKASAKIPGWDYQQIPYIDAWGRTELSGNAAARAFHNFLNPAYTASIQTSDMEKELLRLYESTGEAAVFPERADKKVTAGGETKQLTADEYVTYAVAKGQESRRMLEDLVRSSEYKAMSDAEKAAAVKNVYDLANQTAKEKVSAYEPQQWVENAVEAERKYRISRETYAALRAMTAGIEGLKDKDGETIQDSKGLQIMEVIYNTPGLNDSQRAAMAEYLGVGKKLRKLNKAAVAEKLARLKKKAGN